MKTTALFFASILSMIFIASSCLVADDLKEVKNQAERFIKVVDNNQSAELTELLHPEMLQYVNLGDKLIPFKAADFIQMVADKKLGGVPRKITHKAADLIRGDAAYVVVNAVSSEYDFMYHLSFAKSNDQWVIVGILVDVIEA